MKFNHKLSLLVDEFDGSWWEGVAEAKIFLLQVGFVEDKPALVKSNNFMEDKLPSAQIGAFISR